MANRNPEDVKISRVTARELFDGLGIDHVVPDKTVHVRPMLKYHWARGIGPKEEKAAPTQRTCLGCGSNFASTGKHNRLCGRCANKSE